MSEFLSNIILSDVLKVKVIKMILKVKVIKCDPESESDFYHLAKLVNLTVHMCASNGKFE